MFHRTCYATLCLGVRQMQWGIRSLETADSGSFKLQVKNYFYKTKVNGGRNLRPPLNSHMSKKQINAVLVKVPDEIIIDRIIVLRNKKVMIDRDLAALYGVTTKRLNEQVKRNSKRFPDDFMFQVTTAEKEQLIQIF